MTPLPDLELLRGTLDLLILKTLSWGPMHGLNVLRWIEQTTRERLQIEEGALYPALHRMEQKAWLEAEWGYTEKGRRAKYYQLTPLGRRQLGAEVSKSSALHGSGTARSHGSQRGRCAMNDRDKDRERPRAIGIPGAPTRVRKQVDEELRFHIEERIEELMLQGLTRAAAEAEATRRFGDLHRIGEETARVDRETLARRSLLDRAGAIKTDARIAWRGFARRPLFACVVVFTLALAIGGNGAIFSALNAVLLRPFSVPALDRLIIIQDRLAALGLDSADVSPAEAADLVEERELFDGAAGWTTTSLNLEGDSDPERVSAASTIGPFFEVFRAKPLLGRLYDSTDAQEGRAPVAVLSYALWQQRFDGDPGIVGRNITMSGRTFEVRGVMPPDFGMPRSAQLWIPLAMTARIRSPEQRMSLYAVSVARLREGLTLDQVRSRFPAVTAKWRARFPDAYGSKEGEGPQLIASPLVQHMAGALRPVLLVLVGAVGLVLLIACANVASLQLVRAAERGRELAVRAAMGAGRGAIARQLMVENALLGIAGGTLGLALAAALTRGLRVAASTQFPALHDVALDSRVILFTLAVTILAVLLFGLLPVVRASRVDVREALSDASRGSTGGLARHRLLASSVVAQIAFALVLLSGSVLTLRSLARLLAVDPGFRASGVVTMRVSLPGARYGGGAARSAFFDALVERAQSIPGVQAAGIVSAPPLSGYGDSSPFGIVGRVTLPGEPVRHADIRVVGGDYFKAMGIPVLRGRALTAGDGPSELPSVVIDESLAQQFFRGQDPLGRQISQGRPSLIVGVVGSVKHKDVSEKWKAVIYYSQHDYDWLSSMTLVVRSTLPPSIVTAQVRQAVKALDPSLPPYEVMPMTERVTQSLGTRKLAATVLGAFAAISILLVILGVWGVIGYRMSQRTQEIGIRMALGARPVDIRRMVLRDGLVLAGLGSTAGVLLFLAVSRALAALLYGVGTRDPLTLLAVTLALAVVGLAASWIPARRAARVNPLHSMRTT